MPVPLGPDTTNNEIKLLGDYDYFIFNNIVDKSAEEIFEIIKSEKSRVARYKKDIFDMFEREKEKC